MMKSTAHALEWTVLLCLVGGSADAIAYLRFGTFVGAMTGNTVLLGIDIADKDWNEALYHFGIIAVFLLAVVATRAALLRRVPLSLALAVTVVALGASEFVHGAWSAAIGAAALGCQNAAVRKIGGVSINTAFITGDLVRLGSAVPRASEPAHRNELAVLATAWIAYAAGAVLGAAALHVIGYPMFVPATLALLAAILGLFGPSSR